MNRRVIYHFVVYHLCRQDSRMLQDYCCHRRRRRDNEIRSLLDAEHRDYATK
jgi:hypothetical protein